MNIYSIPVKFRNAELYEKLQEIFERKSIEDSIQYKKSDEEKNKSPKILTANDVTKKVLKNNMH